MSLPLHQCAQALRDSAGSTPCSYSPKRRKLPLGVKEGRIRVPAPPDTKEGCFSFSLSEYSSRQRGKTLPLYPLQHCQNMHQIPIYSRRRGLGVHAKPQPSAMLNQSDFALTWTLSPFLLSLFPKLVKKACTQELLWLFPTTTHHTQWHAEEQRLGSLIQKPKQVAHKNQQRNTTAARAPGRPSFRLLS